MTDHSTKVRFELTNKGFHVVADNGQRLVTECGEVKNEFCNDF